jgi:hypothetical protein
MVTRAATRKAPKTQTKRPRKKREGLSDGYWDVTHRPLQCLVFLLPLVLAYEAGMALLHGQTPIDEQPGLAARQLLQWFFSLFGVKGLYLPGIAVVVALLLWQITSVHPWRVCWYYLLGMAGESVLLSLPMLILNELILRSSALAGVLTPATSAFDNLLLSVGAGIYEELVFRLVIVTLLMVLLIDVAGLKQTPGVALTVIISSLMFAAHHYAPIGADTWSASAFAFRAAAGAYLAAVFVVRGFGLAVGCHVFYDIIAFALP